MQRRKFLSLAGMTALSAITVPGLSNCANKNTSKPFEGHVFEKLPYAFNALEPTIDAQTMELHYSKHHQGYYNKFMAAIKGTELEKTLMPDIFKNIHKYEDAIKNNGGGYYNHSLFWKSLSAMGGTPSDKLSLAITSAFGSMEDFKLAFSYEAKTQFGSGWAWLVLDKSNNLVVGNTANQDNPLMPSSDIQGIPLITLDIWEHAYYLKYQNKRTDYIQAFWDIVNWNEVNKRYESALTGEWIG